MTNDQAPMTKSKDAGCRMRGAGVESGRLPLRPVSSILHPPNTYLARGMHCVVLRKKHLLGRLANCIFRVFILFSLIEPGRRSFTLTRLLYFSWGQWELGAGGSSFEWWLLCVWFGGVGAKVYGARGFLGFA